MIGSATCFARSIFETSRHALEHALAVAKCMRRARVTVLHAIHPLLVLDPPVLFVEASREPALTDVGSMRERLREWLDTANAGRHRDGGR